MTIYDSLVTGTSGNTHYYKFEGNGTDSKSALNMTIASGYSTGTAGREGNALTADGSSKTGSYVPSSYNPYLVLGGTYTIEIWFKYTAGSAQELMRMQDDVALEMNTDGTILYYFKGSIGTTTGAYGDGAWHHLVITRDGSRNVIVYVDGVSEITFTAPSGNPTAGNLYFAGSQYSSQAAISGQMDSVAIYTGVALSSGTVTAHLNTMGSSGYTATATTASATLVAPTVTTFTNAGYTASAMTASALVVDPTRSISDGFTASAMTADATVVAPTWATDGNVLFNAEHIDAYADMPGGQHEGPVTVTAGVMSVSDVSIVAPSVSVQVGVNKTATPLTATARWVKPSGVNGSPIVIPEAEDKYFNRVYAATPKIWFRLDETSGTHADDRMDYFADSGATYHGVQLGGFDGPEGRASVHFNGSAYMEQIEATGSNIDETTPTFGGTTRTTLEFGIRTTKKEQFIMGGRDDALTVTSSASIESAQAARELYLRDGKIAMVTWYFPDSLGHGRDAYQFTGFRDLADGLWHHVVVKGYNSWGGEEGVEIWVDGKLEIRRTGNPSGAGPWNGMPDYVGWRPDTLDGEFTSVLPGSLWFEGDISELAFYGTLLSDDAVPRHYYDFMGWNPIEATPAEGFAFTPSGTKAKGNQKRMLVLTNAPINGDMAWNPFLNDTSIYTFNGVTGNTGQYLGYKVFPVSINFGPGNQPFRDPVTDVVTFINLKSDLDIHDYDVIAFTDWIWNGVGDLPVGRRAQYERLIEDIRWACDQGLGLFITHPRLALDLGIIDRIELAPSQKEIVAVLAQGNAQGLYDYGSAAEFPWNIAGSSAMDDTWAGKGSRFNGEEMNTDPNFLANKAYFYGDTHKNDNFRVRALIEGLTDIPSYMTEKAIFQVDQSLWGWQIAAYKYLHRENGLQIGDEYIFWGTDYGFNNNWLSSMGLNSTGRWGGAYATPLANVKAGTVVTTFGSSYWQGKTIVDNPYKDYATTIVLQPGDSLKGRPVGGKVYVNFSEQPWLQADTVVSQVIPTDTNPANWPATYHVETNEQRQWDYSDTRKTLSVTGAPNTNVTYNIILPDGSTGSISGSLPTNGLNMVRSNNLFPTKSNPSWQMNRRGLLWLYDSGVKDGAGDTTIRVAPLTATAEVKQPTLVVQKSRSVLADAMLARAQMPKVAEDQSGDVEVFTFPLTAHADFTGYSKVVSASPMTATVEFNEPAEIHGSGEQVVLTLHGYDVTLFLKEEA